MRKNPHAVALGRKGGKKGGAARFENLTLEELAARQGWQPSGDPDALGGVFPNDFDVEAFVAELQRRHRPHADDRGLLTRCCPDTSAVPNA